MAARRAWRTLLRGYMRRATDLGGCALPCFRSAAVGGVSEHDVLGMESRLAQLRADMKYEKEKRSGGAPFWNRGQEGRLHNYRTGKVRRTTRRS